MSCIKVPITKTDKGGFQVAIDLNLYSEKAITATIYRYTDKYFVYQNTMPNNDKQVCVIFESKDSGGCVKMYTPSFLCTKPRLSQARALLFPKVFVPLGIKKISL